jgi:hypothetical protein
METTWAKPREIAIKNQKRLRRFIGQPLLEKEKDENCLFLYCKYL